MKLPIYLDNQATTQLDPRALEMMMPYLTDEYGNPHSRNHPYGWNAEDIIEKYARPNVAKLINAHPKEIIFTSGATESNNMAIKGVANFYKDKKNHIITTVTEHKCVLDTCRHLEQKGFEVTYLPVDKNGLISLTDLKNAIKDNTLLVSIMIVNNEIGVIQPIEEIGKICRANNIFFHTDAAQAFGKIPIDVEAANIDLLSISAHKIYGPKGVGALYIRRKPRVRIEALINGGGQERGMRSGTLSPALIAGFGKAAELAALEMKEEYARIDKLSKRFYDAIKNDIEEVYLNGDLIKRYPGNLNLSFACVEGESLLAAIKDLAVSSGSACTSASLEPSYVLQSLGVSDELAHTSIRFGIGRFTTEEQIDWAIRVIKENITKLREMSPLWEMFKEGVDLSQVVWSAH